MRTRRQLSSSLPMTQRRSVPWSSPWEDGSLALPVRPKDLRPKPLRTKPLQSRLRHAASIVVLMGLLGILLGACGAKNGATFEKKANVAIVAVSGVVNSDARYKSNPGMGASIGVRVEAQPRADLTKILSQTLKAFASASDSVLGATSVSYYVYATGQEQQGIRPTEVGLQITPTVSQIQEYAKNN